MLKKLKYFVLGGEDEIEYEDDDVMETEEMTVEEVMEPLDNNKEDRNIISDNYIRNTRNNLVDVSNPNHMKVIVYKPKKYSDAEQIVKNLKMKKPVVVNIEDVEVELARKIFNFCSGAICALDGEMRKISKEIFILAPNNVTLDTEKMEEKEEEEKPFDWRK
jgi:cell division inhibitor SepF